MILDQQTKTRIDRAYTQLVISEPFFAAILLRMKRQFIDWLPTMAVDGTNLYINPEFVKTLDDDELKFVLAHEVMHIAFMHHLRMGARKPEKWNVAGDFAINRTLVDHGMKMPKGGLNDTAYNGLASEQIYDKIPDAPQGNGKGGGSNQSQGGGSPDNDPGKCGGVIQQKNPDGSGMSDSQRGKAEKDMVIVVQQAANAAKRAGKLPVGAEILLDSLKDPKIPWRELLSRFIGEVAKNNYSWMRPNTRYIGNGICLPSMYNEVIGKVVFIGDTSGSMINAVGEVAAEALSVLQQKIEDGSTAELTCLWADTEVYEQVISMGESPKPVGGGGTDFTKAFERVATHHMDAKAVVCVTDGYISSCGEDPGMPVIWVLSNNPSTSFMPPFGDIAHIDNE